MSNICKFFEGKIRRHIIGGAVVTLVASLILYGFAMFVTWGTPFAEWPSGGRFIYGGAEIVMIIIVFLMTLENYFD